MKCKHCGNTEFYGKLNPTARPICSNLIECSASDLTETMENITEDFYSGVMPEQESILIYCGFCNKELKEEDEISNSIY